MNIQIFGTGKCFDTKKAQRYFKERRIPFQLIDLRQKGLSKGELRRVKEAVGGLEAMIDPEARDRDALARVQYSSPHLREDVLLENQQLLRTPIVRNGQRASIGYCPERWDEWIAAAQG